MKQLYVSHFEKLPGYFPKQQEIYEDVQICYFLINTFDFIYIYFYFSHPSGCKVSLYNFDLRSVMTNNAKHIFKYILAIWITCLGKYPFRSFSHSLMGFPGDSMVKNLPVMQETQVQSLGQAVPLEKEMAIYFNILAWKILGTQEPGGLQSIGLQKSQRLLGDLTTTTYSLTRSIVFLLLSCNIFGILDTICLGTR